MSDDTLRRIDVTRLARGHYVATNARGAALRFGEADDEFSPVELLLTAIAGCTGTDVDYITSRRSEPSRFTLTMTADKVRDEGGNRLTGISLTVDVAFPEGEAGDAAREVLPRALQQSHDRLCTVSRTVELASPVDVRLAGGATSAES